jgi:hypothetical protein
MYAGKRCCETMQNPSLHSRILACAGLLIATLALAQSDNISIGAFSSAKPGGTLPEQWQPMGVSSAKNPTRYTLVDDAGITVLRADANASASGITRRIAVDPAQYPLLRWRWKAGSIVKAGDVRTRGGDDYPARIYVMFDYPLEKLPFSERMKIQLARTLHDPNLPAATLCYVWDAKAPAGTMVPSSYTDRVRMVVVESGAGRVNQWLAFERNVAADFRAAFGEEPPSISAVAVASDTDNTGESVTAWFGDISFHKQPLSR